LTAAATDPRLSTLAPRHSSDLAGAKDDTMDRTRRQVRWADLCERADCQGRWVALDAVRYDTTGVVAGELVDFDESLASLCARMQSTENASCAILYCDAKAPGRSAYRAPT